MFSTLDEEEVTNTVVDGSSSGEEEDEFEEAASSENEEEADEEEVGGGDESDLNDDDEGEEEENESDLQDGEDDESESDLNDGEVDEDESDQNGEDDGEEDEDESADSDDIPDDNPDADADDEVEEEEEEKSGWADAMLKVLNAGKTADPNKPLLLSKAKKDSETFKKKPEEGDAEKGAAESAAARREKKREKDFLCRSKPDIAKDRAREKRLAKLATRGVVQLFNAVREQQKHIKTQLDVAGRSMVKRDKVFKNIDKEGFLEVLSGNKRRIEQPVTGAQSKKAKTGLKTEVKDEEDESSWKILRDDFMMGAKMKDWDKKDSDND
jgi:hypothetical protein